MKKTLLIAALTVSTLGLAACEKKAETPKAEASADPMTKMAMPAGAKMGKGTGTVIAFEAATGKITLDHSAIPGVGWSAMTMAFSIKPDLLKDISVGEKVDFDVTVTGSEGEVTAITKKP
jgi:Cu(I)/Ag(I) efflux system protein CusF